MAVIVMLNGTYIGSTHMSAEQIRKAETAGFTILEKGVKYGAKCSTLCG